MILITKCYYCDLLLEDEIDFLCRPHENCMQNFKIRKKEVSTINATTFQFAQLCLLLTVYACYQSVTKTERNKLLGSPRYIWQENIKMDIKERGFEILGGVYLVVDRDELQAPITCK